MMVLLSSQCREWQKRCRRASVCSAVFWLLGFFLFGLLVFWGKRVPSGWLAVFSAMSLIAFGWLGLFFAFAAFRRRQTLLICRRFAIESAEEAISTVEAGHPLTLRRDVTALECRLVPPRAVYWLSEFGPHPFIVGKTYRLRIQNDWICGYEELPS